MTLGLPLGISIFYWDIFKASETLKGIAVEVLTLYGLFPKADLLESAFAFLSPFLLKESVPLVFLEF